MSAHEISPIDRRDWWPLEYMDEMMPEGRPTPTAWLYRLDDGALRYGDGKDKSWPTWPVGEGQAATFLACDDLGKALLTFDDDGTPRWTPRPPDDTYLNEVGDWEMGGDGPDDFVQNLVDLAHPDPGDRIEVNVWRWSDKIECRFTAQGGEPRFLAIAALPAAPEEPLTIPPDPQIELFAERGQ